MKRQPMRNRIILMVSVMLLLYASVSFAKEYGVYVKVVSRAQGGFDQVTANVEQALRNGGWKVLASYNTGIPDDCDFRSRVIVFTSPAYAKSVMTHGVQAAFALPLRVGVYEDEEGIHVAVLNPVSINRTVLGDKGSEALSLSTLKSVSSAIANAVPGNRVNVQMGEMRSSGKITGMGGGDFADKIDSIHISRSDTEANFKRTGERVKEGIQNNKGNWRLVYTLDLSEYGAMLFGITEEGMEKMAFTVAKEKGSKLYKIPVLYHNTAFPIEVIVYRENGRVKVVTLDEMYRMKLFFQDAGSWQFLKHMRKPRHIQDEIVEMVQEGIMKHTGN